VELDTVAKVLYAWYRLVGTTSADGALTDLGEGTNDVAYLYLTRGSRKAQRWMADMGYGGWRKRGSALSWSGADATDGGRYSALPSDFLRAYGSARLSALRKADGTPWGQEVTAHEETVKGDFYYLRGEQLWITRLANPPSALYLEYHYKHPAWDGDTTIDFPMDARPLIVAEAANVAKEEDWFPHGPEIEQKIERALARAREEARGVARQTKQPRQFQRPRRIGNRW